MTVNGNSVHVSMPFAKVDKDQRLVSGWATLDNIDSQGDIVLADASAKAFARARGNIREMHQPLAVGRMVDFREDEFYQKDPITGEGKFYRGIFVTARVSEGAEDTWKKVLDGTLTGFSIGGEINEASKEFDKSADKTVRLIKDYDLVELSLVDNPANQLANVLSIQKNATGSVTVKGMAVEAEIESVFVCNNHDEEIITVKADEISECPDCGKKMENIGWFETTSEGRKAKTDEIVSKYLAAKEDAPTGEGGVDMTEKNQETAKEVGVVNPSETFATDGEKVEENEQVSVPLEDAADVDETNNQAEDTEETPAASPVEVEDEGDTEIAKRFEDLHVAVKKSLDENRDETLEKVSTLETTIAQAKEEFLSKVSELEKQISGIGEKVETSKTRLADLENKLEKVNSSEAIRKSADLEPAEKTVQKTNFWGNAFSG